MGQARVIRGCWAGLPPAGDSSLTPSFPHRGPGRAVSFHSRMRPSWQEGSHRAAPEGSGTAGICATPTRTHRKLLGLDDEWLGPRHRALDGREMCQGGASQPVRPWTPRLALPQPTPMAPPCRPTETFGTRPVQPLPRAQLDAGMLAVTQARAGGGSVATPQLSRTSNPGWHSSVSPSHPGSETGGIPVKGTG